MLTGSAGRLVPGQPGGLAVEVDERPEPGRRAADDGDGERQPERARPDDRLRRAADGDPDRQRILQRARVDAEVVKRRPVPSRPGHPLGGAQREQQVELLGEQLVVVVQVVAEQGERLDERPPARHDLGPSAREQVEGGKRLEHPHRVVRAEHAHGARQADALRVLADRGEGDGGSRHGEVGAMVLADAEHLEAGLLGQLGLLDQLAQPPLGRDRAPGVGVRRELGEGVDADLHPSRRTSRRAATVARGA